MKLEEKEMRAWVDGYISAQQQPVPRQQDDGPHWAVQRFFDLEQDHPELCWQAILQILHRRPGDKVLGLLAAGPLEDLIDSHGPAYIDRIEAEAGGNPEFRRLLAGVWESSTAEVWHRVLRARAG